jgi:hypothetical protein
MQELHDELEQQQYEVESRRHAIKHAPTSAGATPMATPSSSIISSSGSIGTPVIVVDPLSPIISATSPVLTTIPLPSSPHGHDDIHSDRFRASLDAIAEMASKQWPRARGTFIDPATNQPVPLNFHVTRSRSS